MKTFLNLLAIFLVGFSLNGQTDPVLNITPSTSPFALDNTNNLFYEDIAYGNDGVNTNFDIFLPDATTPSSLLIIIHGGGFINGDKSDVYSNTFYNTLINNLLDENVAVATINYHLVVSNDNDGIIRSLNDCKRALQFMRYYSVSLNLNPNKVAVFGTSAGAAA
ncbi:MAG TPA: alpha/beta hydrolase, partial [Flavobacteriaceae bacterium]|nr:alpha/beta hydrolase [Flavobacteriaceae bacterium]